jgi:hypothetical protein
MSKTHQKQPKRSIIKEISHFVTLNNFVLLIVVLMVWYHQIFVIGGTVSELEKNQNRMIVYLRKNVSSVHYLTATGMLLSTQKSNASLVDERFKSYIANQILETFVGGLIKISSNYTIQYASPEDIIQKNSKIQTFTQSYISGNGAAISAYARSVYRAILENKYPEYMDTIGFAYADYQVTPPSEATGFETIAEGSFAVKIVLKSWIPMFKKWDTREKSIVISFKLIVNPDRYAKIDNPFGLHFLNITVPVLHKPTSKEEA